METIWYSTRIKASHQPIHWSRRLPIVVVAVLLPAIHMSRVTIRQLESQNNIRQSVFAFHSYHDEYKRLPTANAPERNQTHPVSWRVKILPFLDRADLYKQYHLDEPWDSEDNLKLIDQMPDVFRGPNSRAEKGHTVFLAASGDSGAFPNWTGGEPAKFKLESIPDGLTETIALVEVPDEFAVPWTKPDFGIDPDNVEFQDLLGQHSTAGSVVATMDGAVLPSSNLHCQRCFRAMPTRAMEAR
ncbi:MAG: DUF1559 domain-containing protein [Pirellulaceae bacterium]